jgi:hypothetical protein
VQNFKNRHSIKSRVRHSEAASVDVNAEEEMKGIQLIILQYKEEDCYNMDETGLYWKMTPSRGLMILVVPSVKKEKARVTLTFCTNATGSDRFIPWIIGTAKTPRSLRNVNVSAMGGEWRWNKKAWMNTTIMSEWLKAFYLHIGTERKVLLTMDNFSAHKSAVEETPPPANIQIRFLPANSTSLYQPLDQGIIQDFKTHYRQQWLSYMLEEYEHKRDPVKTITIRKAIQWTLRSWYTYVSSSTVAACFSKASFYKDPPSTNSQAPQSTNNTNIADLYKQVQQAGSITDAVDLSNFHNPIEETQMEVQQTQTDDEVLEEVVQEHLGISTTEVQDDEDTEQPEKPMPTIQAAREAIQVLIDFAESQDALPTAHLRAMERLEQELDNLHEKSLRRSTLERWFT